MKHHQWTPGRAKSEHQAGNLNRLIHSTALTHRLIADVNGTLFAVLGLGDAEVDSLFTLLARSIKQIKIRSHYSNNTSLAHSKRAVPNALASPSSQTHLQAQAAKRTLQAQRCSTSS
jgi:hypothetical protein